MDYQDTELVCSDCASTFAFTASDQQFYAERQFQNPKRCPVCREQRRGAGGSGRQQRELHSTTCSTCGQEARVPFIPRLDRPVYCSDCYQPAPRTSAV